MPKRPSYGFQKQQRDMKTQKKRLKQEAAKGEGALPADPEQDENPRG